MAVGPFYQKKSSIARSRREKEQRNVVMKGAEMSEYPIPEDLKPRYNTLSEWLVNDTLKKNMSPVLRGLAEDGLKYIERIAKQAEEASNDQS